MQSLTEPQGTRIPKWPYAIAVIVLLLGFIPLALSRNRSAAYVEKYEVFGENEALLWVHTIADLAIAVSGIAIAAFLLYVAFSFEGNLPFTGILIGFAAAHLGVALVQLASGVSTWTPIYGVSGAFKWATAITYLGTALAIPPLIPKLRELIYTAKNAEATQIQLVELTAELEQRVEEKTREARESSRKLALAGQEERKRLSTDIHDGLTQTATAAYQQLQVVARKQLNLSSERVAEGLKPQAIHDALQEDLQKCLTLAQRVVTEARSVLDDLRPKILDDFGLKSAITQKVNQLNEEDWNIHFHFNPVDNGYEPRGRRDAEAALYRVLQESLTNIRKHAKASRIDVTLDMIGVKEEMARAILTITDNGIGFNPGQIVPQSTGPGRQIGLESRKELIEQLGGEFTVQSAPGRGTTVRAELPLDGQHQQKD